MTFTTSTFAPQIEYESGTYFNFASNDMHLVTAPSETWALNWDNAVLPDQDGGDSYGGEVQPLILNLRFEMATYDPNTLHTRMEALKTALKGRAAGDTDWPTGHFKLYYHRDGATVLYLEEVTCESMRTARRADKFYKGDNSVYTIIDLVFRANDPAWKTSAGATSTNLTVNGTLIIDVAEGDNALEVYNTDETEMKAILDSSGNAKLRGEVQENQSSVS